MDSYLMLLAHFYACLFASFFLNPQEIDLFHRDKHLNKDMHTKSWDDKA